MRMRHQILPRVLNEAATEKAQAAYEQQLTEELQKAANDIHYGNAHAGIHVTIHRVQDIPDRLIRQYEEVAPPLLRASMRLQSSILPPLKRGGGRRKAEEPSVWTAAGYALLPSPGRFFLHPDQAPSR